MAVNDRDTNESASADQSVTSHSQSGGVTAHTININSRDPLFEAQLEELKGVYAFIAQKDENELRETFDLPEMLRFNTRFHRASLTGKLDPEVEKFFENGGGRIAIKKVVIHISPTGGAHKVDPIPGHIYAINISQKYIESRRKLSQLSESIVLPSEVIDGIKELDGAIDRNSDLMLEVLDERFRANPKNIIEDADPNSSRCGAVNNAYWKKFEPLKPFATKIGAAVRKHLKVG